eukprot:3308415-Rhodomonas_salina.2
MRRCDALFVAQVQKLFVSDSLPEKVRAQTAMTCAAAMLQCAVRLTAGWLASGERGHGDVQGVQPGGGSSPLL